jgi:putative transposase
MQPPKIKIAINGTKIHRPIKPPSKTGELYTRFSACAGFAIRRGARSLRPLTTSPHNQRSNKSTAPHLQNRRPLGYVLDLRIATDCAPHRRGSQSPVATHPNRKFLRLSNYDYSQPGMYFLTICTHERQSIFGAIDAGYEILNASGTFVESTWHALPHRFPNLKLDTFIVMPNHVHGIVFLESPQSSQKPVAASGAPTDRTSLAHVVRAFKSLSAIGVNKIRMTPHSPVWQRNYYEHIIRTVKSLDVLRRYIKENPATWHSDTENPLRVTTNPNEAITPQQP